MTTVRREETGGCGAVGATILLSTYNGARFLDQFLKSLSEQNFPDVDILVRDDGSSDATCSILERWAQRMRVRGINHGPNIGACQSFLWLLRNAPADRFVLLADQDDIWYPDKVSRAIASLRRVEADRPALYCARVDVCDANGHVVNQSPLWPSAPTFGNALVENIATGCTVALNTALLRLIQRSDAPTSAIMHDWWLYLVAAAFGEVLYDSRPCAAYRLHATNVVGLPSGRTNWLISRIRRLRGREHIARLVAQAQDFERVFNDRIGARDKTAINLLTETATWRGRWRFLRQAQIRRQFAIDTIALKAMVATNRGGVG